jgi:hypothetical protein
MLILGPVSGMKLAFEIGGKEIGTLVLTIELDYMMTISRQSSFDK